MDYFKPDMTGAELDRLSNLALAHVGDAVFSLMVRARLALEGRQTAGRLHIESVRLVNAPEQARRAEKLLPVLSTEELAVFKRGRNAKVGSVPKASSVREYHEATGLEALFGWLYLRGETERLNELFDMAMEAE